MTTLNNKKLKKLLKSKSRVKIEQNPDVFYKEFLKSTLFIPVIAVGDEDALEDGVISEKERRLLDKLMKINNISAERASEIEKMIGNK